METEYTYQHLAQEDRIQARILLASYVGIICFLLLDF